MVPSAGGATFSCMGASRRPVLPRARCSLGTLTRDAHSRQLRRSPPRPAETVMLPISHATPICAVLEQTWQEWPRAHPLL